MPVKNLTAKDLVEGGATIHLQDGTVACKGTLPPQILSYGSRLLGTLDYGQTADDPCTAIDLPLTLFNHIAPAAADVEYLTHAREVDATGEKRAVVVCNRLPPASVGAQVYLVSLEGMADYLPSADGTRSPSIGPEIELVRLIVFRSWTFTANEMDESLRALLLGLNVGALTLPVTTPAPTRKRLATALANQAAGKLSGDDATVLMTNALAMGYVPMSHHLRGGGNTVSFYRGPLAPLPTPPASLDGYYHGPDAANAYDPQTGLFDVSCGAAWQLGHLLALQNAGMANELYQWKRSLTLREAWVAEQAELHQ